MEVTLRANSPKTEGPGMWQCCFLGESPSSPEVTISPLPDCTQHLPWRETVNFDSAGEKKRKKKEITVFCSSKTQNRSCFLLGKRKFPAPHGGPCAGWLCGTGPPPAAQWLDALRFCCSSPWQDALSCQASHSLGGDLATGKDCSSEEPHTRGSSYPPCIG